MFCCRNEKGFNLFTALISFLLIMLAVLLIQSMIQSERKAADTIANIEARSRLEATAEMARADAMQVFNYALRKKIEDWLTKDEYGSINLRLQDKTWEQIQEEFAESRFGGEKGNQFANFAANSLEGIFYSPSHFGNYTISLDGNASLKAGISKAISKSLDDFFTVIECENGDPRTCEKGTFYVNLHIERLTQEEYESLPTLHVVDRATGGELKEIILPRTTFRIYVPLRFFKAIAEARALTHFPEGGGSFETMSWIDTGSDGGLFSPKHHNEIEQLALGMCDYGYCAPRTNPLEKPGQKELSGGEQGGVVAFCPGDNSSPNPDWGKGLLVTGLTCNEPWCASGPVPTQYNANNNEGWGKTEDAVGLFADAKVCSVIMAAREAGFVDVDQDDKFSLVGKECGNLADRIVVEVESRESKVIGEGEPMNSGSGPGRNIGLFRSGDSVEYPSIKGHMQDSLACADMAGNYKSRCAEVVGVKVTLAFREEDPNYMVREAEEGEERIYRISVNDNTYVPFTANWNQGSMGGDYLYSGPPQANNCSTAPGQGWHCVADVDTGPAPPYAEPPKTVACRPG